jgi:hypothetical protein
MNKTEAVEMLVRGIMENFPDVCVSLDCVKCDYKSLEFHFVDFDDPDGNKLHVLTKQKLIDTVPLMFGEKWPKGCTEVPKNLLESEESIEDWLCQSDGWDDEAFVQLAIYGELVYG